MDTSLFIEIILTEGAVELWQDKIETEDDIRAYLSLNKQNKVFINLSEDDISQPVADAYLEQLGMLDLIGLLPF
jgi:hypothetical protein